jgi:hypothetical protein
MNRRVAIMLILVPVALLLAAGLAIAQPLLLASGDLSEAASIRAAPQADHALPVKEAAGSYAVQAGTVAGGSYQLVTGWQAWSVRGASSGGSYRIDVVSAVRGTGTPCCCSYLSCLWRGYR